MTVEQFWDGSPYLCVAFRKMHEMKKEEQNQQMWWQGFYNWQAFSAVMSEFSWGLNGKKGKKPEPYLEKPVPITEHEKELDKQDRINHTMKFIANGQK